VKVSCFVFELNDETEDDDVEEDVGLTMTAFFNSDKNYF
jgi:hypothetical protein